MYRSMGVQGTGYGTTQRTRIWGTDTFASEFGAQNGTLYPHVDPTAKSVEVHEVWVKYTALINRLIKMAVANLSPADAEVWAATVEADKSRFETKVDADGDDSDRSDSSTTNAAAGPRWKDGHRSIYSQDRTRAALEEEAEQYGVLAQFASLFTPELSIKMLPTLKRLHRILEMGENTARLAGSFMSWRMNFYLSRIVDEVVKSSRKLLTQKGDFMIIPILVSINPRDFSAIDCALDLGIMLLEYDEKVVTKARVAGSAGGKRKGKGDEETFFRLTIVNPSPLTDFHPKGVDPTNPTKIKQQVAVTALRIPKTKIFSEAFWATLFLIPTGANENVLYTHMLTWLTRQPYVEMIAGQVEEAHLSSTVKFDDQSIFWKSLTFTLKYLLQRFAHCTRAEAKLVRFGIRLALIAEASSDLKEMKRIKEVSKVSLHCGIRAVSSAVARNEALISLRDLERLRSFIEDFENRVNSMTSEEDFNTPLPPKIDVTNGWDQQQQPDVYPLIECLRRIESTEPYAGAAIELPKIAPVNMTRIRPRVRTFVEALEVIDELVLLGTRIAMQDTSIANSPLLVFSAIAEAFIEVIPAPLGPKTRERTGVKCIWADLTEFEGSTEGIRYGQQLHLLKRLSEIAHLFFVAIYQTADRVDELHLEAIRLTVMASISAIADAVVRIPVTDCPSFFAQHYVGWKKGFGTANGERPGFAIDAGQFNAVSSDCVYVYPEALLTRQSVLDYFEETVSTVAPSSVIFRFKNDFPVLEAPVVKFFTQICKSLGISFTAHLFDSDEGANSTMCRQCLDFVYFRDITVLFRTMTSRPDLTNATKGWSWQTEVTYDYDNVRGFFVPQFGGRQLSATIRNPRKSLAAPELYLPRTSSAEVRTVAEEDILHTVNLGELGSLCGMRDAELLLSYLTVPYMRIPLTLRFFACEDRASLLRYPLFQRLITCVLFDAGRFLPLALTAQCPTMVPAENDQLIATPYGLLLNELMYNPAGVIDPMTRLVQLVLELDSGNVSNNSTMNTIQFLSRLLAHTFTYLRAARRMLDGALRPLALFRDVNVSDADTKARIDAGYAQMRGLLTGHILPIFLSWIDELEVNKGRGAGGEAIGLDAISQRVAFIRHDILLLMRGLEEADFDADAIKTFLSAMLFLTTRYSWRTNGIQEVLVFLTAHLHRRALGRIMSTLPRETLSEILNFVVQSVTRAGQSEQQTIAADGTAADATTGATSAEWGLVGGVDCVARFCRLGEETNALMEKQNKRMAAYQAANNNNSNNKDALALTASGGCANLIGAKAQREMAPSLTFAFGAEAVAKMSADVKVVPNGLQDVEINFNTYTVTFKNAHLQALPEGVTGDSDLKGVDGLFANSRGISTYNPMSRSTENDPAVIASLQCAIVDETVNRQWLRLVAQDADIVSWRTDDPRIPLPSSTSMRFYPEELTETEAWIRDLFEPIRQMYLERSFWEPPIFILLPDRKLTVDNSVVMLSAVDSSSGQLLKEVYVYRDMGVVHFFDLFSFCRRFYRTLVYSSDDRYTLCHMNVSKEARQKLPAAWQRYEMGNPKPDESFFSGPTISIVRHPFHPLNKSGSRETYLPSYILYGVIPEGLLDEYSFWQDDDDNIRGYPIASIANGVELPKDMGGRSSPKKTKSNPCDNTNEAARDKTNPRAFADAAAKAMKNKDGNDDDDDDETDGTGASAARNNHILWIHWRELQFDALGTRNTTVRIVRFANADECPRSSEGTIRRAYKNLHVDYETEEDLMAIRKDGEALGEDDTVAAPETLEAGPYQQAKITTTGGASAAPPAENASVEDSNLLLVNLMNARAGTPLFSLARALGQIESMSHILVWTRDVAYDSRGGAPMSLDLIHLPRLKLSFTARLSADGSTFNIYSMDHAHLFISNIRPPSMQGLMQGIPFALVMADANENLSILVPSLEVHRPIVRSFPYSTYVVPIRDSYAWTSALDTRYYLYPIHVSLSFLFTPTLAAALYLLQMRLMNRNYKEGFALAGTIGTDVPFTAEEKLIFAGISMLRSTHPLALACWARMSLMIPDTPWHAPAIVTRLLVSLPYVDVDCRLSIADERRLLYTCDSIEKKLDVVRDMTTAQIVRGSNAISYTLTTQAHKTLARLQNSANPLSASDAKVIRKFYRDLTNRLREKLDVRASVEDLEKLLRTFLHVRYPPREFFRCLLWNRRQVIDAEASLAATIASSLAAGVALPKTVTLGDDAVATRRDDLADEAAMMAESPIGLYRITINAKVPEMGAELAHYDPDRIAARSQILSCRMPNQSFVLKNKEGRQMTISGIYDVYYCGMKDCRGSGKKCPCGNCGKNCGENGVGCPCTACRDFNRKEGLTIRQLPAEMDLSTFQPSLMFFDVFTWMTELIRQYVLKPRPVQKDIFLNGQPAISLRVGQHFTKFYGFATGASRVKICNGNCALDLAELLLPLTFDSRVPASGLGHLMNYVVFNAESSAANFHQLTLKDVRNERGSKIAESIYEAARAVAAKNLPKGADGAPSSSKPSSPTGAHPDGEEGTDGAAPFPQPAADADVGDSPVPATEADGADADEGDVDEEDEAAIQRLEEKKQDLLRRKKEAASGLHGQGTFELTFIPRLPTREDAGIQLDRTSVLPIPANCDCNDRVLSMPDMTRLSFLHSDERDRLSDVQTDDGRIEELCTHPLLPALRRLGASPLVSLSRREQGLPEIPSELPFDLTGHDHSRKTVAKDMLSRIESDMKLFAERTNHTQKPKIVGLTTVEEIAAIATGSVGPAGTALIATLDELLAALAELRASDQQYLQYAMPLIVRTANQLGALRCGDSADEAANDKIRHSSAKVALRRFAYKEATMNIDFIIASLATRGGERDWAQLNPFLDAETIEAIMNMTAIVVLRANRIAHINRACDAAADLREWLGKAMKFPRKFHNAAEVAASPALQQDLKSHTDAVVASILLKSDSLADHLDMKRCYFEVVGERQVPHPSTVLIGTDGGSPSSASPSPTGAPTVAAKERRYDARFLLFEFTWSLVLRDRQRELITEMHHSVAKQSQSLVKQMIMGAGKTTVVGPLLGVMLSDGSNLVLQVVPPALLDFTRSVMRTTFSSVMRKQIFSFTCDRSGQVDSEILHKFEHAKASRGIVVTTPNSIKSIFLKYVEALDKISDAKRSNRSVDDEKEVRDLHRVIGLWRKSVLVMDEVDLILHPLKSELNFPVGPKEDIDFSPLRWKLPIHLLDAIFYCSTHRVTTNLKDSAEGAVILKEFRQEVEAGLVANSLQSMPHLTLLNVDFYDKKLKPLLAKWLLLFIKSQLYVGLSDEDTLNYITRRPGLFSTAAQRAKANNTTEEHEATAEDADTAAFIARVAALDDSYIKVLNLSFEWLTCYLPHIWQKVDRVSYGIMNHDDMAHALAENPHMPQSRFVTAIPFVGKDLPSQSSEFAHPDVVIGLTILAYRYEGMRDRDFQQVMTDLYAQVEAEVGKYSQRRTNLLFNRWVEVSGGRVVSSFNYKTRKAEPAVGGMGAAVNTTMTDDSSKPAAAKKVTEILPLKLLKQANTVEIAKLFRAIRKTAEVIHFYLSESLFPTFMKHQNTKLSASGQELGGSILFDRRVGFSGTPSDLLPVELGHCEYEKGTDGQLIHTLTDIDVVKVRPVAAGWSVKSLLKFIANHETPYRYNALIDTGALITGLSNRQVAAYLLRHGLKEMDGVVFLDELDRKMILVRATGRVLKLAECGIPRARRFAFYDQVHTTGMDIDHTPNAFAVQTIGKDMTFRDFSQGAYRMRGIGVGQKVDLLIIPEVRDLITRSLAAVAGGHRTAASTEGIPAGREAEAHELQDVTAWLLTNSMRSEHTQNDQLCMQSCANVWRKEAFAALTRNVDEFKIEAINKAEAEQQQLRTFNPVLKQPTDAAAAPAKADTGVPSGVRHANAVATVTAGLSEECNTSLNIFREPVIFDVNHTVPKLMLFSEIVENLVEASRSLIRTPEGNAVVDALLGRARREDEVANPAVDVQVVQEQEEERDKEQEEEKEQQVEIEKYVDLAYSRDSEAQTPWPVESLASLNTATQFYPLSSFHLYKRRSIEFPDCIFLSRNFFNPRWSGHRRIRNVIAVIEWVPNTSELKIRSTPSCDYGALPAEESRAAVAKLFGLVSDHDGLIEETLPQTAAASLSKDERTKGLMKDILEMALQRQPVKATAGAGIVAPGALLPRIADELVGAHGDSDAEWDRVLQQIIANESGGEGGLSGALYNTLASNDLRLEESGRYFVVVSLAEAETIRRITHLRSTEAALLPSQSASSSDASKTSSPATTTLALKAASCGFATLDKAQRFVDPQSNFMPARTFQCLRFFDCDLHYTEREFGLLLRSMGRNAPKARQAFFQQVCGCRRRLRQRWERTPVAGIFILATAFSLLHQRAIGLCARRYFDRAGLSFGDAFMACNSSRSGALSPGELWGGLRFCRLEALTSDEVVEFIELVDSTHENQIQYGDFLAALTGSKDYEEDSPAGDSEAVGLERCPTAEGGDAESIGMGSSRANTANDFGFDSADANNKNLPEIEPYGADILKSAMALRAAQRRAAEAEANAELEEENQRVLDVIEEEEISAELELMNERGNPMIIPGNGMTYNFMFRSEATTEALYGKAYAEEIEDSKGAGGANKKARKAKASAAAANDPDAEEDEEEGMLDRNISIEERREMRARRPMTLEPPAIVKAFGNRVRASLDVDGSSCLTVHSDSAVNVPLRVLKRLLGPSAQQVTNGAPTIKDLASFVISAELRFPSNAAGFVMKEKPKEINQKKTSRKNDEARKEGAKSGAESTVLGFLGSLGTTVSFAEWMLPMIERRALADQIYSSLFVKADAADDDADEAAHAEPQNATQSLFQMRAMAQQKEQQEKEGGSKSKGAAANNKTLLMTADYLRWLNKEYFFLQESNLKATGEGTLGTPTSTDVLTPETQSRKAAPKKDVFGLRILKNPRPPREPSDILGVLLEHDFVVAAGPKTLNEINGVVYEWALLSSPCEGWVLTRRENVKTRYGGPESGSATSSALPTLPSSVTGAAAAGTDAAAASGVNADPIFVSLASIEGKPMTTFFDAIRTRLSFDASGNGARVEHSRHNFDENSARRFAEPCARMRPAAVTPSTQNELIVDREMEIGKAIAANGDSEIGELTGEVSDLLAMIVKAKRLRQGCSVIRNTDHVSARETQAVIDFTEVGIVTTVENETCTVRWPGGNTMSYAWGKGGIFELVKVADEESEDENELNEDGTVKRYGGGLGGRVPLNDDQHVPYLKKTSHRCDNCSSNKLIPTNWFRCNHCSDFDLCRKCYKAGTHEEHDMTDMGALQEAEANREKGGGGGANGDGDNDDPNRPPNGVFVDAEVRVKADIVAPRFGWGTEHESFQEEQQSHPHMTTLHWPSSLSGFVGTVTEIDQASRSVTIQIDNVHKLNKPLMTKTSAYVEPTRVTDDSSDDENFEAPITVTFVADYSELEPLVDTDEVGFTAIIPENPAATPNLFKMMPYAYYMLSALEQRISVPAACNSADTSKPLPSLRSRLTETKANVIATECPYIKALASRAADNLVGPFNPSETLIRRNDIVTHVASEARFMCPRQRDRVSAYARHINAENEKRRLEAARLAKEKRRANKKEGDTASDSSASDDSDDDDNKQMRKGAASSSPTTNSENAYPAVFDSRLLNFETRINALTPFHMTTWYVTSAARHGTLYTEEQTSAFIRTPYRNDMMVRFVNFPTPEKPLDMMPAYFKPEHYGQAIGNVVDIGIHRRGGNTETMLTVRWNVQYEWGGDIQNQVHAKDVAEVKGGQWYIRNAVADVSAAGSSSGGAAPTSSDDAAEEQTAGSSSSNSNSAMSAEEKLFFNDFSDGGATLLTSAVNALLERGLRDGKRLHTVFIRDDNYSVDLLTGEVRRLKPASERSVKIDDDMIDLASMTPEQRDQVSRLMGSVFRFPNEPFVPKDPPPSVDDGLRHTVSLVVQPDAADGTANTHFVIDGRVTPIQFAGCFNTIRDAAVRSRLISRAMRLFFHCPISMFGVDMATTGPESKNLGGPVCHVYYLCLDYDAESIAAKAGGATASTAAAAPRDLLMDTIALHQGIEAVSEWICSECSHSNSRLAAKCAKCKRSRRARVVGEQSSAAKFKVATMGSREANGIRSRLQGKLKAQYQRELDTIDRAQDEIRKAKMDRKANAGLNKTK